MKIKYFLIIAILFALTPGSKAEAQEIFGYKLTTDVVYGQGKVKQDGKIVMRDLKMDVYEPVDENSNGLRPAVVLVHGGAWHRGGRRYPPYEHLGGIHSMMEGYARLLAPLGYVCFIIEYRLVPDNPVPTMAPDAEGLQDHKLILTAAAMDRLSLVRSEMNLSLLTTDDSLVVWNGVLAGAEDTNMAVTHVRDSAQKYGIDPERIALGGHSAGAGNTLNAAYGLNAKVAAIFPLSPPVMGFNMQQVIDSPDFPPMLLMLGQNDLGVVLEGAPGLLTTVREAGVPHDFVWVPGFGHFYPTEAVSLGSDGIRKSVGERVSEFLGEHLK